MIVTLDTKEDIPNEYILEPVATIEQTVVLVENTAGTILCTRKSKNRVIE